MDWAEQGVQEAKAARARLELQSSGDGRRLNVAGVLNALTKIDATRQAPGFEALNSIRERQRRAGRSASAHNASHDAFTKAVAAGTSEGFNRLFPRHKLAAASAAPTTANIIGDDDARSERYTPNLAEARRLLDALGRLAAGDRRALDLWSSGTVTPVVAQWLAEGLKARITEEEARQVQEAAADAAAGRRPLEGRR
jgi:hypothetical protein